MRGDKDYPFDGVTSYGRVWRKCAGKLGLEFWTEVSKCELLY